MERIFEWLYQVVHQITLSMGYPGIFLLMLVENLLPPIPSELVMPFSGFMIAQGELSWIGVLAAGTLGSLAGAVIIYKLSHHIGEEPIKRWVRKHGKYLLLSEEDLDRALKTFEKHGKLAILLGRLIPGVRSLISIPAGLRNTPWPEFIGLTLAGTLAWNALLIFAGYHLGANWSKVLGYVDTYETFLWIALGLLVAFFLIHRLYRRSEREQEGDAP